MPGQTPFRFHKHGPGRAFNADRLNTDAGPLPGHASEDLHSDSVQYQGPSFFQSSYLPLLAVGAVVVTMAWLPSIAPNRVLPAPRALTDVVSQVNPTLATLPGDVSWLAITPPPAQPPHTDKGSFTEPVFVPAAVATPTIASWLATLGVKAQPLDYAASTDYAASPFANFVSPFTFSSWNPTLGMNSQPARWLQDVVAAPPYANFVSPFTFSSWQPTLGANALKLNYRASSIDQGPTSPLVSPFTLSSWLATFGEKARPQMYAQADVFSKHVATLPPAPITISMWLDTDGQRRIEPTYAQTQNYVAPDKFNITTPAVTFLPGWSSTLGLNAQPPRYAAGTWSAPDKMSAAILTLNSFVPTEGVRPVPPSFQPGTAFAAPDKYNIITPATTFLPGWAATLGVNAQPQRYAPGAWTAPDKMVAAVFTLSSFLPTEGVRSVPPTFKLGTIFAAPDKFNIVTPATTFLPAWSATLGVQAQPQRYPAMDTWTQPPTQPAIVLTIASWTASIGARSQPSPFAGPSWNAPDKMTGIAPAVPNIAMWTPTLGVRNQKQIYFAGASAQPVFTPFLIGPFVLRAIMHRTYTQWSATHQTYSQYEAVGHQLRLQFTASHQTYTQFRATGHQTFSALSAQGLKIVGLNS